MLRCAMEKPDFGLWRKCFVQFLQTLRVFSIWRFWAFFSKFSNFKRLGSRSKDDFEKKYVKYLAFTNYWPQRENITNQYFFFERVNKYLENISLTFRSYLLIFLLWDLKLFELLKKYGISQIHFFRKINETNIHPEIFLEILFCTFWYINRLFLGKKNFFR